MKMASSELSTSTRIKNIYIYTKAYRNSQNTANQIPHSFLLVPEHSTRYSNLAPTLSPAYALEINETQRFIFPQAKHQVAVAAHNEKKKKYTSRRAKKNIPPVYTDKYRQLKTAVRFAAYMKPVMLQALSNECIIEKEP